MCRPSPRVLSPDAGERDREDEVEMVSTESDEVDSERRLRLSFSTSPTPAGRRLLVLEPFLGRRAASLVLLEANFTFRNC